MVSNIILAVCVTLRLKRNLVVFTEREADDKLPCYTNMPIQGAGDVDGRSFQWISSSKQAICRRYTPGATTIQMCFLASLCDVKLANTTT